MTSILLIRIAKTCIANGIKNGAVSFIRSRSCFMARNRIYFTLANTIMMVHYTPSSPGQFVWILFFERTTSNSYMTDRLTADE